MWVHQKRCHQVGSAGTIASRTNVDEIGFHAGRAALPRAMSAAYHSRATLRWKMPYTMKFLTRVGTWSHRLSFPFARKRYRIRRYSFRPKIDSETTRNRVAAYVSRALSTMRILGKAPSLHQPAGRGFSKGNTLPFGSCSRMRRVICGSSDSG